MGIPSDNSMLKGRAQLTLDVSDIEQKTKYTDALFQKLEKSTVGFGKNFAKAQDSANKKQEQSITLMKQQAQSLHYLSSSLNIFAAAAATGFALIVKNAAESHREIKGVTAVFTGLFGSQQAAVNQMNSLRVAAVKTNVPIMDMLASARELAPTLKLAGVELSRLTEGIDISRRLATLNPEQGTRGAAFAIAEFLQGQTRSLATRFRINAGEINKFLKEANGDRLRALSMLLDKLGVTTATAQDAMSNLQTAFSNLGQSIGLFMATGPEPLINDFLVPFINKLSQGIAVFQQTNPELARMVSLLTLLGLAAPPLILMFIKLSEAVLNFQITMSRLKDAGVLGQLSGLGKAAGAVGVTGAALTAGYFGGVGVANVIGNAARPAGAKAESFEETQAKANTALQQTFTILLAVTGTFRKAIVDVIAEIVKQSGRALVAIGAILQTVGSLISKIPGMELLGERFQEAGDGVRRAGEEFYTTVDRARDSIKTFDDNLALSVGGIERAATAVDKLNQLEDLRLGRVAATTQVFEQSEEAFSSYQAYFEQAAAASEKFMDSLRSLNEELAADLNTEGLKNFQNLMDIDNEWQAEKAKLDESYNDKARNIQKDANERRVEIEKSHSEKISAMRSEAGDEEARRVQDFNLKMQRMQEDHEDNLLSAAARLDALAVVREMQNFAKQSRRATEDFNNETRDRQTQLNQKLVVEQNAYVKEIEQLNASSAEKMNDLNIWYQREKVANDKSHLDKIRAEEIRHAKEMDDLKTAFAERRRVLTNEYIRETNDARTKEINKQLAMLGIQTTYQTQMQNSFSAFWNNLVRIAQGGQAATTSTFGTVTSKTGHTGGGGYSGSYAEGTDNVPNTGMYYLHKGEAVIPAADAQLVRQREGNRIGGSGAGVGIASMSNTLNFYDVGKKTPGQLRAEVETAMKNILEDYNQGNL